MMEYKSKNENQTMLAFTTYLQFCEGKYIMWNVGHEFLSTLDLIVIKATKKNNKDVEVHLPISAQMEISPEWMQHVNTAVETTLGVDKVKILLCEGDSKFVGYTIQGGLQVVTTETEQTSNNKQQTFIRENLLKRNAHYIYEEAKKESESHHDTEIKETDNINESYSNKYIDKKQIVCMSTDHKKDKETEKIMVTEEKQKDPKESESENLSRYQNEPEKVIGSSSKDSYMHNEEIENKTKDVTHEEKNDERKGTNDDNLNVKEEKECNDQDERDKENNVTTNDGKLENRTVQDKTPKDSDCTNELQEKHELDAVEINGQQNREDDKIEKSQLDEKETLEKHEVDAVKINAQQNREDGKIEKSQLDEKETLEKHEVDAVKINAQQNREDDKIEKSQLDEKETREKHEVDAVETNQNKEDDKIEKSQLDEKETDEDRSTPEIGQKKELKNTDSEGNENFEPQNQTNVVLARPKLEKEDTEETCTEEQTQGTDESNFDDENENDEYKELVQTEESQSGREERVGEKENNPALQGKTSKEKLRTEGKKIEKIQKKIKDIDEQEGKRRDKKESQVIDISSSDEDDNSSNDEDDDSENSDSSNDEGETDSDVIELSDNSGEDGPSNTKKKIKRTREQASESSDTDTSSLSNSDIEEIQVIKSSPTKNRHKNWKDKKKEKKGDDLEVLYEVDDRKSFFASQIVEVVYSNSMDDADSNSMLSGNNEDAVEIVFEKEGKSKKKQNKRQRNSLPDLSQFSSKKKRFFQY